MNNLRRVFASFFVAATALARMFAAAVAKSYHCSCCDLGRSTHQFVRNHDLLYNLRTFYFEIRHMCINDPTESAFADLAAMASFTAEVAHTFPRGVVGSWLDRVCH